MANLKKVDPSSLPDEVRRRLRLIEHVRQIAAGIEYEGRGDTAILAKQLDLKGVKPLRSSRGTQHGKWYQRGSATPTDNLRRFVKRYLPDLWPNGFKALVAPQRTTFQLPPVTMPKILSKKSTTQPEVRQLPVRQSKVVQPRVRQRQVIRSEVIHERLDRGTSETTNIMGWTIRADDRGTYRAFKKIAGKTRCVYIGKDSRQAAEKIREWTKRERMEST